MGDWYKDPMAHSWSGWRRTVETTVVFEAADTLTGPNNTLQVFGNWRGLWATNLFRVEGRWPETGGELVRSAVSGVNDGALEQMLAENLSRWTYNAVRDMTMLAFKAPVQQAITMETWPDQSDPNKVVCRIHGFEGHSHYCLQAHYRHGKPPRLVQPPRPLHPDNKTEADKWLRQSVKELDAEIRKVLNVDP